MWWICFVEGQVHWSKVNILVEMLLSDSQGTTGFVWFWGWDPVMGLVHTLEKESYTPRLKEHPSTTFHVPDCCPAQAWQLWWLAHCVFTVPIIWVLFRLLSREKLGILSYRLVLRRWIAVNPLISCWRTKMQMFHIHLACDKNYLWVASASCKSITFLISSRGQYLRILPIVGEIGSRFGFWPWLHNPRIPPANTVTLKYGILIIGVYFVSSPKFLSWLILTWIFLLSCRMCLKSFGVSKYWSNIQTNLFFFCKMGRITPWLKDNYQDKSQYV